MTILQNGQKSTSRIRNRIYSRVHNYINSRIPKKVVYKAATFISRKKIKYYIHAFIVYTLSSL